MARIVSLNPNAAQVLETLRTEMRDREVAQGLAKTALQRAAMAHKVGVMRARQRHKRLPRVTLS
jgi:hypothetical protein